MLAVRRIFTPGATTLIAYGLCLIVLSLINQPDVLFSALSWVAGLVAREAFNRSYFKMPTTRIAGVFAVGLVLIMQRRFPTPDPVLGTSIAFMIAHVGWAQWNFASRVGDRLSRFSYSLYAMHFPVLLASMGLIFSTGLLPRKLPLNAFSLTMAIVVMGIITMCAILFAKFTEEKTSLVRRALIRRFSL